MNDLQLRAYGCVAQAMAQLLYEMAAGEEELNEKHYGPAFPDARRPIFYHYSMSLFEAAAHDLWRLRILRPLDQERDWAYHFVFDCELGESNVIAERNSAGGPPLFELLVSFINLFGEYGIKDWRFSAMRDIPFDAGSRIRPAIDALARLGYLTESRDGYVWTELIAPIMRASYESKGWPERA